jgi:outer membrane putative beta-barrel porin/alpha-amylase
MLTRCRDRSARTIPTLSRLLLAASLLAGALPCAAADGNWKLSESITYEQGTFGTGTETTTVYVPTTIKRYFEKGDFSLIVPFIHLDGSSLVTTIEGVPIRGAKKHRAGQAATTSANGIGDMVVKGSYYLLDEESQLLNLSPVARIKIPTASRTDGLGTGKVDGGFGVEASKTLHQWTLFTDAYYTIIGSPVAGQRLDNQFAVDFGAGDQILSTLSLALFYEVKTAIVPGTPSPQDLMASADYKLTQAIHIFGGGSAGLSDGSPDYGLTAGASVRF